MTQFFSIKNLANSLISYTNVLFIQSATALLIYMIIYEASG
jgi:hypothetical protein